MTIINRSKVAGVLRKEQIKFRDFLLTVFPVIRFDRRDYRIADWHITVKSPKFKFLTMYEFIGSKDYIMLMMQLKRSYPGLINNDSNDFKFRFVKSMGNTKECDLLIIIKETK